MVDENTLGRESIIIVEIDQDLCSRTYGTAPCTASVGVTGDFKCYNTFATCQDSANYAKGTALTLRFCTRTAGFPGPSETEQYIPIVQSVSSNPTEINLANGNPNVSALGKRASVTIKMRDIPYNDARVDPYRTGRGFNPSDKSTFWRKWLRRNPYFQNRALRVREGYVGQNVSSMRTRHYIIDKITGVDSNDQVTIVAKDILKLADDKKAQAPVSNTGALNADITDTATSATLSPSGIGDEEYPASGKIRIGDEVMSFTRSGDTLTLTRAINNTDADDHSEGDLVQLCLEFTDERIDSILETLLNTYGNVSSSYLPTTDWSNEADSWLSDANLSALITKPTGVTSLIGELLEQTGSVLWWDEVNQEVKFRAVRPVQDESITDITEESHIIANSFSITREPEQRVSQLWFFYDINDPTKNLKDESNYKKAQLSLALDKEGENQYDGPRIRSVYSRWLTDDDSALALSTASKIVLSYKDNPVYVQFSVDAKDRAIDVSSVLRISHRSLVDSQGDELSTLFFVISRHEVESGHKVTYKCIKFGYIGRFGFIMDNAANDYTSATQDELDKGCYITNDSGLMSDSTEGWKII